MMDGEVSFGYDADGAVKMEVVAEEVEGEDYTAIGGIFDWDYPEVGEGRGDGGEDV